MTPLTPEVIHAAMAEDPLMPTCGGTHLMGYATCQRIALMLDRLDSQLPQSLPSVERELRNSSVVVRDTEYVPLDIALSLLWNLDS